MAERNSPEYWEGVRERLRQQSIEPNRRKNEAYQGYFQDAWQNSALRELFTGQKPPPQQQAAPIQTTTAPVVAADQQMQPDSQAAPVVNGSAFNPSAAYEPIQRLSGASPEVPPRAPVGVPQPPPQQAQPDFSSVRENLDRYNQTLAEQYGLRGDAPSGPFSQQAEAELAKDEPQADARQMPSWLGQNAQQAIQDNQNIRQVRTGDEIRAMQQRGEIAGYAERTNPRTGEVYVVNSAEDPNIGEVQQREQYQRAIRAMAQAGGLDDLRVANLPQSPDARDAARDRARIDAMPEGPAKERAQNEATARSESGMNPLDRFASDDSRRSQQRKSRMEAYTSQLKELERQGVISKQVAKMEAAQQKRLDLQQQAIDAEISKGERAAAAEEAKIELSRQRYATEAELGRQTFEQSRMQHDERMTIARASLAQAEASRNAQEVIAAQKQVDSVQDAYISLATGVDEPKARTAIIAAEGIMTYSNPSEYQHFRGLDQADQARIRGIAHSRMLSMKENAAEAMLAAVKEHMRLLGEAGKRR